MPHPPTTLRLDDAFLTVINSVQYYVADELGSARVVTSALGAVLDDSDFYPFGGERAYSSSSGNVFKFEGKERDAETGNDDFGARYYSNRFGRWLSADWSSVPVPVPYANLTNPQTLNLYSMVADDPESFADLDGHCTVDGEKHNWIWCAGHSLGITETKKETAAREAEEKRKSEEYFKITGRSLDADVAAQFLLGYGMAMGAVGGAIEPEPTPTGNAAIDAGAAGAEAGETEITAANGTKVTGFTTHGVERAVGEGPPGVSGVRAGTTPQAILDALRSPKSIKSGIDSQGRPYQIFNGKDAKVIVNPQNGKIVSVNPTSAAGAH